jgi:hypothetical protein
VLSKHDFSFVVRFAVCEPADAESIRVGLPNPCATVSGELAISEFRRIDDFDTASPG